MKTKYVKPALVMERFEMTQSIAASCGAAASSTLGDPNIWYKSTCAWVVGGVALWDANANEKCTQGTADMEVEGLCYNNPTPDLQIFGS